MCTFPKYFVLLADRACPGRNAVHWKEYWFMSFFLTSMEWKQMSSSLWTQLRIHCQLYWRDCSF